MESQVIIFEAAAAAAQVSLLLRHILLCHNYATFLRWYGAFKYCCNLCRYVGVLGTILPLIYLLSTVQVEIFFYQKNYSEIDGTVQILLTSRY